MIIEAPVRYHFAGNLEQLGAHQHAWLAEMHLRSIPRPSLAWNRELRRCAQTYSPRELPRRGPSTAPAISERDRAHRLGSGRAGRQDQMQHDPLPIARLAFGAHWRLRSKSQPVWMMMNCSCTSPPFIIARRTARIAEWPQTKVLKPSSCMRQMKGFTYEGEVLINESRRLHSEAATLVLLPDQCVGCQST